MHVILYTMVTSIMGEHLAQAKKGLSGWRAEI